MEIQNIGLKIGLEIHQQLDTKKLFCRCPSFLRSDSPEIIIRRKLHSVAGESGEVDVAAKHEMERAREFTYEGYHDNCCLIEYDESPPREINKEALQIALHISLLLNCKIIPITQIMRKTVINGSNTSGFQRTVLIARDGYVETEYGRVGIESVFLEEDAARIIKSGKEPVFRLDRLGIPLVEIATAPDIKTPEQAKEVALHIGDILRSCKVKRGLGTIRQDVNVSIRGENRVELKGMQDMDIFLDVIEKEIARQKRLSDKKTPVEMEVRGAQKDGSTKFMRPLPGSARMYPETDLPLLKLSRNLINEVKKSLPKLRKEIEKELRKTGLSQEMIKILFKKNRLLEFKELLKVINKPKLIAKVLLIFPKDIARREKVSIAKVEKALNRENLYFVLEALKKKKISESHVKHVFERIVRGEKPEKAIAFEKEDMHVIEEKIRKIIKKKPGLSEKAYMGLVMKEFRGKLSGRDAMEIIKKYVE